MLVCLASCKRTNEAPVSEENVIHILPNVAWEDTVTSSDGRMTIVFGAEEYDRFMYGTMGPPIKQLIIFKDADGREHRDTCTMRYIADYPNATNDVDCSENECTECILQHGDVYYIHQYSTPGNYADVDYIYAVRIAGTRLLPAKIFHNGNDTIAYMSSYQSE